MSPSIGIHNAAVFAQVLGRAGGLASCAIMSEIGSQGGTTDGEDPYDSGSDGDAGSTLFSSSAAGLIHSATAAAKAFGDSVHRATEATATRTATATEDRLMMVPVPQAEPRQSVAEAFSGLAKTIESFAEAAEPAMAMPMPREPAEPELPMPREPEEPSAEAGPSDARQFQFVEGLMRRVNKRKPERLHSHVSVQPEQNVPPEQKAIAIALQWSQVLYLDNGKLDVITPPILAPHPDFEFKGYDISKDRQQVAAWFVRKGATGIGTRRPGKGIGSGTNRTWHHCLNKAKQAGSEEVHAWKRMHSGSYVPREQRSPKVLGPNDLVLGPQDPEI